MQSNGDTNEDTNMGHKAHRVSLRSHTGENSNEWAPLKQNQTARTMWWWGDREGKGHAKVGRCAGPGVPLVCSAPVHPPAGELHGGGFEMTSRTRARGMMQLNARDI